MGLSDYEQRILDELERTWNDSQPSWSRGSSGRTHLFSGIALVVAGFIAMITAVAVNVPLVGVVAFLSALTGVMLAMHGWKRMTLSSNSLDGVTMERPLKAARKTFQWRVPNDPNHPGSFGL